MPQEESTRRGSGSRPRLLMRGESVIASTGLALVAIFMMAIASAGGWTVYTQRRAAREHLRTDLENTARLLADSAEPLLASESGLADVRTLLVRSVTEHHLLRCRIVRADGSVLADSAPSHQPDATRESAAESPEHGVTIESSCQVSLPDQPQPGRVQVSARIRYASWTGWEAQTGIGVIGALGFTAFLLVYRRLRSRLRAVGAIREALLSAKSGEGSAQSLSVSERFGPEAVAWNAILGERDNLRRELLAERARESLGTRSGSSESDLVAACDALWQGLIILDHTLTITYANGAAAVFLRAKGGRDALPGTRIIDHPSIADPQLIKSLSAVASGQVRRRTTLELKLPGIPSDADALQDAGGTPRPVAPTILRFTIRPLRREDAAAALLIIEDITQQRIADEARNSFVAQATHELRTPLTNIRLYVEQAIETGDGGDPAVRVRALDVINQESRRLERIVADMLSVSEIEAGSFKLRTGDVRLEHLFDDLKAEYQAQAAEKQITLALRLPPKLPVIKGDRDKIVLALHNLIGNAIKYTPAGGRVEVRVEADARQLKVDIVDSGIGVSPEETDLIFEKFYRAKDQRVSQITGTGLGLTLAREVVRLHGGDITVQSQLDKGSTFTMTIPTLAAAA